MDSEKRKYWFFGSKLNTALLVILIVLMVIALRWMNQNREMYTPVPISEQFQNELKDGTYTYINHGFSIELPKGFVPVETQGEGGPGLYISLPGDSIVYYGNNKFWKDYVLPSYKYIKDEKIGETVFKVFSYDDHSVLYWYEKGNVGYELYGSKKSFETFKFVGWPQEKAELGWVKSPTFGLYYSSNFTTPTEFYRVSGLGPDRGKIVYEPTTDTVPVFSLTFSDGKAVITWGDVWKGGYMPGTCTNDEFGSFEYGVSSVACVKGYRTWVAHFSARDSVSKDELKIFGDFVLKNK